MSFSVLWEGRRVFFNVETDGQVVKRAFFSKDPVFERGSSELSLQLEAYFSGERVEFDCILEPDVSSFVSEVLRVVRSIPYGNVKTYGEIAMMVKSSPRAVGQALKRNPIPILIPCHRVVAKSGIGGYSAGVELKRALLELEGLIFD